jgi:uncharacterized membrane protein (UPF0127 family)
MSSKDPVQQALRDKKRGWNTASKEFIKRLIALKKGLNGRGDPQYGIPVSQIQNPMPDEVGALMNELSSNFDQLAQEALSIVQEQLHYSQTRRKSRKEMEGEPKIAMASAGAYLKVKDQVIPTELAITADEQARGLMYQEYPPVMSFVYGSPSINRFWMKSTPAPLDIVFCLKGRVINICAGEPYSTKLIGKDEFSDLVVEMPLGTCQKLGVEIGDQIALIA